MKHKWLTVLLALVAAVCLCFGLAACGGNGGNGGNSGNGDTQTEQGSTEYNQGSGGDTSGDTNGSKEPEGDTTPDGGNPDKGGEGTGGEQTPDEGGSEDEDDKDDPDEGGGQGGDEQKCKHEYTAENVCALCGDKWEYTEGLNYVYDESTNSYAVGKNSDVSGDVVIPYGYQGKFLTKIGRGAFSYYDSIDDLMSGSTVDWHSELTSITIPDCVTSIGGMAFYGCDGLTRVDITDLAAWCKIDFEDGPANPLWCAHLFLAPHLYLDGKEVTTLTIPKEITEIKLCAFWGCTGLTGALTIPDGVTKIGGAAFSDCSGLTSVTIGNGVTEIGRSAFSGCSGLTSVTIGNGVTEIGNHAFV